MKKTTSFLTSLWRLGSEPSSYDEIPHDKEDHSITTRPQVEHWNGEVFYKLEFIDFGLETFHKKEFLRQLLLINDIKNIPENKVAFVKFFYLYAASTVKYKQGPSKAAKYIYSTGSVDCSFYTKLLSDIQDYSYETLLTGRYHGRDYRISFEVTYVPSVIPHPDVVTALSQLKNRQLFKVSDHAKDFGISINFHQSKLLLGTT